MGFSWDSIVNYITGDYDDAYDWQRDIGFRKVWANTHWSAGDDHLAIEDIIGALDDIQNCVYSLIGRRNYGYGVNTYGMPTLLDRNFSNPFITADDVTWKMIAEAWSANDFEGRFWTIALIDRMRQILWNEPFDIKWASKPEVRDI